MNGLYRFIIYCTKPLLRLPFHRAVRFILKIQIAMFGFVSFLFDYIRIPYVVGRRVVSKYIKRINK